MDHIDAAADANLEEDLLLQQESNSNDDRRRSDVHFLTQDLEQVFEKRYKLARMNAIDRGT